MIKAFTIINHLGESIRLDLFDPYKSGFIVESVDGLGPVQATLNFTELATNDGALDNTARLTTRNITMSLRFLENPTIEDTRLLSYRYFPIKQNITFQVETDNRVCRTVGRVESNEPKIFDKEEGCNISIVCADPYFYRKTDNKTVMAGVEDLFEFPFSNESLTEDLIEFGKIVYETEKNIFYDGDGSVGLTMEIHAIGDVRGLKIYNAGTRELMVFNDELLESLTGSPIKYGDTITIKTERGEKSVILLRNGVEQSILNVLEKPISWFRLTKGNNMIAYIADEGITNLRFVIQNKVLYEGV